jgi:hypothetical protein
MGRRDAEIVAALGAAGGYTELGELDAARIGAAYRHDYVSAHRYLADALDSPPAVKLSAPVTVVVAADDPSSADFTGRYRDWQFLADRVDLHELADGGHYFPRTRPAETARAVLRAVLESTPASGRHAGRRDGRAGNGAGRPAGRILSVRPGVLDLAVGKYVYDEVTRSGDLHVISDFFHELRRYG